MYFNTGSSGYSNTMDRDYNPTAPLGVEPESMPIDYPDTNKPITDFVPIKDIGMSVPLGIAAGNVEGVAAKIRAGAGSLELGFPGYANSQRNAQTPEVYGYDARQALRELGKINEVKFTTHSSYGVMGMLGSDQQGNVSLQRAKMNLDEVNRAIEFARDVSGGGSVVVHTGEFERPLTHIYPDGVLVDDNGKPTRNLSRDPSTGRLLFKKKLNEPEDASWQLIDDRTGQGFQTVQMDRLVAQPIWLKAEKDYDYVAGKDDPSGRSEGTKVHVRRGEYIDYENRVISDPFGIKYEKGLSKQFIGGRVPKYEPKTGRFITEMKSVDDFEREAREYNQFYSSITGRKPDYWDRMTGREMYLKSTLWSQAGYALGWALQFSEEVPKQIEKLQKLQEVQKFYEKADKSLPEEEKWKLLRQDHEFSQISKGLIPPETKNPLDMLQKEIEDTRKRLEYAQQSGSTQEIQAKDTIESMRHLRTPEKYFEKYGTTHYALAAIKAMNESKNPNNPIVITLENIFPERFGGHPEELKLIIEKSRERMVDLLTKKEYSNMGETGQFMKNEGDKNFEWGPYKPGKNPFFKGLSREEAEKIAAKHIKATIDTGHLNTWRKFWVDDPKKNYEDNQKEFDKWMLKEVEDLAKRGMIGNVHLTDNYGYHDDHLAPGQGNTPVKEIVKILHKYGYHDALTVEPGAAATTDGSDFHGLMGTWRHFGSPIYSSTGPTRVGAPDRSWTNIQYSYFGRTYSPNFVFGSYVPSNDWTLWTQVPFE